MAKSFAITTTATEALKADAKGRAQAVFTVTNARTRPVRGLTSAKALDGTKREWLSVTGESERDFAAGATAQFAVNFDAAGVPPGKYPFRLDVASALNPDEDFTEGPTVTVEVAPPPTPPGKKKFPIWIIIVIAALLLLIGCVILFLVLGRDDKPAVNATTTPTATPTPAATPVSTQRINVASGKLAMQSSSILGGVAARAVDGNLDGEWPKNSVTHTSNEASPWWQVDLGTVHSIGEIRIWNRTDCCGERLSNFYVFVSSTPFNSNDPNTTLSNSAVSSFPAPGVAGSPTKIAVGKQGRFVRIQLMGTEYLSLAEVEVLADVPK